MKEINLKIEKDYLQDVQLVKRRKVNFMSVKFLLNH